MFITRPLVALAILLIGTVLPLGVAHGGPLWPGDTTFDERPSDLPPWLLAPRLGRPLEDPSRDDLGGAGELSDLGALLLRAAPEPLVGDPLTLHTATSESTDLRTLLDGADRWRLMHFGAEAGSPRAVKVTAYGAVAYLPGTLANTRLDAGQGFGPAAADSSGIPDQDEPISLGFNAALEGLEGGAEYRSVGKRLERVVAGPANQRDREGTEVWVAQRLGLLRVKLSQSDLSDNVDRNPALPRTSKAQTAMSAELAPLGWPIFGLTYATGDSERSWLTGEGRARLIERQRFDSVAASAYYACSWFDLSGTSTYAYSRDPGRSDRDMNMLYHDLALTLRPVKNVSVMPSVSTGLDRYEWSSVQNQTASMSLLLSYTPSPSRWNIWTLGAYSTSQSTDHTVDGRTVSASGGLAFQLGKVAGGRASLALEAGYERYVDSVYPDASSRGTFGLVLLKVTSF